jgi:hypothetical protein
MKNAEAETTSVEASEDATPTDSPLFDPANHVRQPIPGVQPIHDVKEFLKTLPHIAADEDDGFYEAILDLRRRSVIQENS